MQVCDHRRADARKLGVIHQKPALPCAVHHRGFHGGFLRVRGGDACFQRHTVGSHERLGEIVLLQAAHGCRAHNGLGLGPQQPAGQEHPAALLGQRAGMGHAVGHIVCLQGLALQRPHQFQRGGACVDEHKVLGVDEGSGSRRNGPLLGHGQRLLGLHGGFLGLEAAVRQSGPTVHLVQLAQPVQLRQVTPDGGLAGAQRLAQLLHGSRALFIQQI